MTFAEHIAAVKSMSDSLLIENIEQLKRRAVTKGLTRTEWEIDRFNALQLVRIERGLK